MIQFNQHALINQMLYKKIQNKIVTKLCANVQPVGRMSLEPWLTILQSQWKLESLSKSKIVSFFLPSEHSRRTKKKSKFSLRYE